MLSIIIRLLCAASWFHTCLVALVFFFGGLWVDSQSTLQGEASRRLKGFKGFEGKAENEASRA